MAELFQVFARYALEGSYEINSDFLIMKCKSTPCLAQKNYGMTILQYFRSITEIFTNFGSVLFCVRWQQLEISNSRFFEDSRSFNQLSDMNVINGFDSLKATINRHITGIISSTLLNETRGRL